MLADGPATGTRVELVAEPSGQAAAADLRGGRIDMAVVDGRRVVAAEATTATAAITSGNPSTFFHVLAYLPPTTPFAMPVLVRLGAASWWQVALSAGVSVACTAGVARAVAVYRTSILRTGRRVPLRELLAR